ncbi:ImmA/IrrE family metallo-endopeptidase [Pectinatus frisingensis]|uniref:ImmA/IrrE family metallo-endopeptidase n=1 Tax=Pectinatus frisingensis TaxID=865 RepID=UPI0018C84E56|nr:ImmA/IrrE family metallo-endopeptidase [Pectinatus frisingensis]
MINMKLRVKNLMNKYGTADPFELVDDLNIKIIHAPLPDHIRGFLVRVLRRKYIILNENLCYLAQKITVCHEIGHAQLHRGYGYYLHADQAYYVPSRREKEANEYAMHLLSHSSDIDGEYIARILNEKALDPGEVHGILGMFIKM